MSGEPSALSDHALLDALVRAGADLFTSARRQLADQGDVQDDPRWGPPLPLRFEAQLPVLFLGALDAFDVAAELLRSRASQQAFHVLRFQVESLALIRWMTEPTDPLERQHRAYRVACGQVRRFGRFMMEDAGRDREALRGVRAVREWGQRLREIAREDGIPDLKGEPGKSELVKVLRDVASSYPTFSMYSELGSHPGTAGATFFALRSDTDRISYDLGGATVERGFFVSASLVYLWKTCETVSPAMGWEEWLRSQAKLMRTTTSPLMAESLRRRHQQSAPE